MTLSDIAKHRRQWKELVTASVAETSWKMRTSGSRLNIRTDAEEKLTRQAD